MTRDGPETVVIGLGNVVLSDDGVGVHAARRLVTFGIASRAVDVVEGGTAGLLLLPALVDARRAIVIDAIDLGAAPGTLFRLRGEAWGDVFNAVMSPHDVGLRDLLGALALSGAWPERLVLHGVQPRSTAIGTELSAPVAAALDPLVDAVVAELRRWGTAEPELSDDLARGRCAGTPIDGDRGAGIGAAA